MGRSQPTTTELLRQLAETQFGDFRRSLFRAEERQAFDRLLASAKNNRMAISQARDVLPIEAAQMAMLIDLQCQIDRLKEQLDEAD